MTAAKATRKVTSVILHIILVIIVTIVMLVIFIYGVLLVLTHGPSENVRDIFVMSCNETSAMKWVPRLTLSKETVDAILSPAEESSDDTFVELSYEPTAQAGGELTSATVVVSNEYSGASSEDWLEIVDINEGTFKGKLMIVRDPSKVIVGTLDSYPSNQGLYLEEFMEKYNAIAATNAGGFYDAGGTGTGGTPELNGIVIKDSKIVWGSAGGFYEDVIGFDSDGILHVGDMTGQQALDLNLVTAVSFAAGPVLVKDGVLQTHLKSGVNPRTCIGQTADGTVLLMVTEGRKPDSIGATCDEIAEIMYSYGAVNAANLDGGSSSLMYYKGEQLTRCSNIVGIRRVPTAILVLE